MEVEGNHETPRVEEEEEEEEGAGPVMASSREEKSPGDGRLSWICELAGPAALFAVALVVELAAMPQHLRAIPVQAIDDAQGGTVYARDLTFDQELVDDTVGTAALLLLGFFLPLGAQLATAAWRAPPGRRLFDLYNTFASYLVALCLSALIVNFLKLYCGYLRPHFYDVCEPDSDYERCTNEDGQEMREARKSFPSGHAAASMAGLGSFSAFLHHRLGTGGVPPSKANTGRHRIARLWSLLAVGPVLLALFMGASRVHDNYHHPADVVGGFAIGGVAAYFCHHVWFLE